MLFNQLAEMLGRQDEGVRRVLKRVIALEQEHISMQKPHLGSHIDEIIHQVAIEEMADEDE